MPIIYTYPTKTPATGDWILISDVSETNPKNATRKCTISDILAMGTGEDYDLNAGAKVTGPPNYIPLNLTSTSGTDDSLVKLTEGTNITLTRNSATEITIDATGGGGGTMSQWFLRGDTGSETVADNDRVFIVGGTGITTAAAATATLTVSLDAATDTVRGGIELGSSTALTAAYETGTDGTGLANRVYPVQINAAGQAAAYVPWTDTDTTYSVANETTLGLVELGSNTTLTQAYEAGVTGAASRTYPVQLNAAQQMAVSVPWTAGGAVTEILPTAFTPVLMTQGALGSSAPTAITGLTYVTQLGTYYVLNQHVYIDFYFVFHAISPGSSMALTDTLGIGVDDGGLEPLSHLTGLGFLKDVQTNNATVTISQAEAYIMPVGSGTVDTESWKLMPQSGRLGKYTDASDKPFAWLCGHNYVDAPAVPATTLYLQTQYDPLGWITLYGGDPYTNYAVLAGSINAILIPS